MSHKQQFHEKFDFPTDFSFKIMDSDTLTHQYSVKTHGSVKPKTTWRCNVALRTSLKAAAAAREAGNTAAVVAAVDATGEVVGVIEPVEPAAGPSGKSDRV